MFTVVVLILVLAMISVLAGSGWRVIRYGGVRWWYLMVLWVNVRPQVVSNVVGGGGKRGECACVQGVRCQVCIARVGRVECGCMWVGVGC